MLSGQVLFCYSDRPVNTTEVSAVEYKPQWRTIRQRPYLKYLLMTCNETKQAVTGLHLHLEHSERDCCGSAGVQDWNFTEHLGIVNILSPLVVQSNSFQTMHLSHSLYKQSAESGTDFQSCWILTSRKYTGTSCSDWSLCSPVYPYSEKQFYKNSDHSKINCSRVLFASLGYEGFTSYCPS